MDAVTLKGRKAGFELLLDDAAAFTTILDALRALLKRLAADTPTGEIAFEIDSGNRLLTADQQAAIDAVFDDFTRFSVGTVRAAVADIVPLRARWQAQSVHVVGGIVRSGQELDYVGDVLFVGTLHAGGTLRATGSIFVMGSVAGLLVAGATGDQQAVIAGDISRAGQIRIADTLEIIDKNDYTAATTSYINDLHILEHGVVTDLKTLRPKLFRKLEDSTWETH